MYGSSGMDDSIIMYVDWQCVCYVSYVVLWFYDVLECGLIMYAELVCLDDVWCIIFFGLNIIWIVLWLGGISWNDMDAYVFWLGLLVFYCDMNVYAWVVLMLLEFEWYVICRNYSDVCFEHVFCDVGCHVELSWCCWCLDCV